MSNATIILDNDFELSPVDPRLFGGFAEHLGRHIYTGIYEPGHPTADEDGFRTDVISLVKELGMPIMRYPGGNFVSGYNWEDGVGPRENRPRRMDLAWATVEPNEIGTNEFMTWCKKVGTAPMLAVNLGTRGPADAQRLVEYCNHPGGTQLSDWRKSHGYPDPHNVKVWCLGNEMDGPWQMGAKSAYEYGRIANEASKMMKWVDPSIETILCGSSNRSMPTFGRWEWEALHEAYDQVDYVSMHTYYGNRDNDTPKFLATPDDMGAFIDETVAVCDAVGAAKKRKKKIHLSFDEWNVWYHSNGDESKSERWSVARPLLEDRYNMEDALVVGGMLIELLNRANRVKIGCIAQVVNVIAPILTVPGGAAWRQTIFHPFAEASRYGRGVVLRALVNSPEKDGRRLLTAAAVRSEDGKSLSLFVINRDTENALPLSVTLRAFGDLTVASHSVLRHEDLKAVNTVENPNTVVPMPGTGAAISGETLTVTLPAASWNVLHLTP
jgi:alpha-N-arabinofuranosidase